ncbi:nucleolin-like isoform X2 [Pseudoliparis swirei]|uniref:nucleolin-like isoform X2 n=1 Tax=Pseudoliparis swirei TaxID=2059687 RepID=UPI0024BD8204|nr:nucleolin-like isoform X2 [Pseudoliparis swirei]
MDAVIEVKGSSSTVTIASDQMTDSGKGKRKAPSSVETTPSKKTKPMNDGYCLYVGNLNTTKTFEEVNDSLANYLMTQSLLVQDIRLDRSKKHAFVDLASEMDLTKGLTLNGQMMHDKPMKIAKANVKCMEKVPVKAPAKNKTDNDDKCLFLKNVPYNATKEDILKIFCQAVDVRFPGGTEGPTTGIAFVEFKDKTIAQELQQQKKKVIIQGRVLIVDCVVKANRKGKANDYKAQAPAAPNNTLFLSNLSFMIKEVFLKKFFKIAVRITIPQCDGKSRGFGFVKFASVADAEKALQSSQKLKLFKRLVGVQFSQTQADSEETFQSKTLIVMGLAVNTTAETLNSAFEGSLSTRVPLDRKTGVSKRFGFVEFESEEACKAAKVDMEDCVIDGRKVTVAYAKAPCAEAPLTPGGQPAVQAAAVKAPLTPGGQPAVQAAAVKAPLTPGGQPAMQAAAVKAPLTPGGQPAVQAAAVKAPLTPGGQPAMQAAAVKAPDSWWTACSAGGCCKSSPDSWWTACSAGGCCKSSPDSWWTACNAGGCCKSSPDSWWTACNAGGCCKSSPDSWWTACNAGGCCKSSPDSWWTACSAGGCCKSSPDSWWTACRSGGWWRQEKRQEKWSWQTTRGC